MSRILPICRVTSNKERFQQRHEQSLSIYEIGGASTLGITAKCCGFKPFESVGIVYLYGILFDK